VNTVEEKELYERLDAIYSTTIHKEEFIDVIYQLCFRTHDDRKVFRKWLKAKK